ncbi:MAG: RluA family pseudouridine synthase [Firmicutes bacterium]|nr:RluA family pseudouridine synthase [Bacillota bacterium]
MKKEELINYTVRENEDGMSIKNFLTHKELSRHYLIKLRNNDKVTVNGKIYKFWNPVSCGDLITINPYLDDVSNVSPVKMDLDILYEDADYIALNKDFNTVTHPTPGHMDNTIANGVLYHLQCSGYKSLHPINRLDKTTSGVIIFAKHPIAQHALTLNRPYKEYIALVEGIVEKDHELINLPIAKIDAPSIRRIVTQNGKESRTEYFVLSRSDKYSLLRITLHTGRTHQIRVHLSHIGHPLVGDFLYGEENAPRLFLHSNIMIFKHFRTNKEVRVIAPQPPIFNSYLKA